MRTTITVDDALYRRVKAHAARTGRTVSAVVSDALQQALRRPSPTKGLPELPVFGGSGVLPGVDLADSSSLLDVMNESADVDALR